MRIINVILTSILSAIFIALLAGGILIYWYIPTHVSMEPELAGYENITDIEKGNVLTYLPAEFIPKGDSISIYDVAFEINGTMNDMFKDNENTTVSYTVSENDVNENNIQVNYNSGLDMYDTVSEYFKGNLKPMCEQFYQAISEENIEPYYYTYDEVDVPVFKDNATNRWCSVVITDTAVLQTISTHPICLTNKMATIHYGKADDNPLENHTFSDYETLAIANKRRQLLDKESQGSQDVDNTVVDVSDLNRTVNDADGTYTSEELTLLRSQILGLRNVKFNLDGKSDATTTRIETDTADAKSYMYDLSKDGEYQEKPPVWTMNGFQLSGVTLAKTSTTAEFTINVKNVKTEASGFAILFKFVDTDNKLIGTAVYDGTADSLATGASKPVTVNTTLNKSAGELGGVQFVIY